ncbi:MAG: hypothetical protein PHU40_03550 [Sulfurimonas sp.]|jgi:hypothetical protein|nr:hypothetical protein [Sulfurimonas sp.]
MKRNLIFSILFIIATMFTALHELGHIQNHDSSSCQICIVDNHSVSFDLITDFQENEILHFDAIATDTFRALFQKSLKNYHSRAPPQHS